MKKKVIVCIAAVVVFVASVFAAVTFLSDKGYILPLYIDWQERTLAGEGYDIILEHKHLFVYKDSECVWESDSKVKVQDVILTDVDRDGVMEMTVLCWKKGRYGMYTPVFGEEDDTSVYSEHVYLYDLGPEKPVPKWMASDLGVTVLSIDSPNGYILAFHERSGTVSEWQWVSWGFNKVR